MEVSRLRRQRLDLAFAEIIGNGIASKQCVNPFMCEVIFPLGKEHYPYSDTHLDLRRKWASALSLRGFEIHAEDPAERPVRLLLRDMLPHDHTDGTILGLDIDGCILQWNDEDLEVYNSGETPEEFGEDSITPEEAGRIGKVVPILWKTNYSSPTPGVGIVLENFTDADMAASFDDEPGTGEDD